MSSRQLADRGCGHGSRRKRGYVDVRISMLIFTRRNPYSIDIY
jgi:hypothetical protein